VCTARPARGGCGPAGSCGRGTFRDAPTRRACNNAEAGSIARGFDDRWARTSGVGVARGLGDPDLAPIGTETRPWPPASSRVSLVGAGAVALVRAPGATVRSSPSTTRSSLCADAAEGDASAGSAGARASTGGAPTAAGAAAGLATGGSAGGAGAAAAAAPGRGAEGDATDGPAAGWSTDGTDAGATAGAGRNRSGSRYPSGSAAMRIPRCTYNCATSAVPEAPAVATAPPSDTVAPDGTPIAPRWVSVTANPSPVVIVTLLPEPGTEPANVTVPPAGATIVAPSLAPMSRPRCWPAAYGCAGSKENG
jgi:hypothetical protein